MKQDQNAIGVALGRMVSGCAVLGAQDAGTRNGLVVSWFQQAAFEPPMVTVALKTERPAVSLIDGTRRFTLSILPEHAGPTMDHFGREYAAGEDAFAGIEATDTQWGPVLNQAVACLGCEVVEQVKAGDHVLVLAKVVAGEGDASAAPFVHMRESGFKY